ncbi:MAG: hypothetical protein IT333_07700 [Thermomicrobiales bacterium]|nr:hypothetical protein [Thermomicrobiales bacterium]
MLDDFPGRLIGVDESMRVDLRDQSEVLHGIHHDERHRIPRGEFAVCHRVHVRFDDGPRAIRVRHATVVDDLNVAKSKVIGDAREQTSAIDTVPRSSLMHPLDAQIAPRRSDDDGSVDEHGVHDPDATLEIPGK